MRPLSATVRLGGLAPQDGFYGSPRYGRYGQSRTGLIRFLAVNNLRNCTMQDPAVLLPPFWDNAATRCTAEYHRPTCGSRSKQREP